MIEFLDEDFRNPDIRRKHYIKHVINGNRDERELFNGFSEDDYVRAAETLAKTPIDHKTILGYVSQDASGRCSRVKWNKLTGEFVAYAKRKDTNEPIINSFYCKTYRDFNADKTAQYIDEIPEEVW